MQLAVLDWLVIGLYVVFAITVGVLYAKRAGKDVDEFFLSGRSLPWWIAGTSMVATTFAADTPLVITGWVRDHGLWQNWLWWCYAGGGALTIFVFARYWRRGEVMTTAELTELRYGGPQARVLRGFLGVYHSTFSNTIILCWVLLAASKIMEVLFGWDKLVSLLVPCVLAISYSLLAGFWGVVLTDLVQFVMAMVGSIILAVLAWNAVGGSDVVLAAVGEQGDELLSFFPQPGAAGPLDAGFWTANVAMVAVYMGVAWWAYELVDGGGIAVQRISASKDERSGVLATLWYNVAHFALRPWPWILVALASLLVLPHLEVTAPVDGVVQSIDKSAGRIVLQPSDARAAPVEVDLAGGFDPDWRPVPRVAVQARVAAGSVVASSDSERAYVVMMTRYLPVGLLGLVVASLLAAFMSTIDTHVNLAASYFVNDIYRRFLRPDASPAHYVGAARVASVCVLAVGGYFAWTSDSIGNLFTIFLSFLAGVGPVYVLRWFWWRVRASTEIAAMLTSSAMTILLLVFDDGWSLGPLSPDGELGYAGRMILIVAASLAVAMISMLATRAPDPETLVAFYRKVRPAGFWGPVAQLCPDVERESELVPALVGTLGALALIFGTLFGIGYLFLEGSPVPAFAAAVVGAGAVRWALVRLRIVAA